MSVASALRRRQTPQEARLWMKLRSRKFYGYKFRRQHPIGNWVVDFACLERKLIVELDSTMHSMRAEKDIQRDYVLSRLGFLVLRFKNHELNESPDWCLSRILIALQRDIP